MEPSAATTTHTDTESLAARPPADLPPAELSANARIVLARRYLRKDESGEPVEEPETMFWRVAAVVAAEDAKYGAGEEQVEARARRFYELMATGLFEPNSPTLMNAGRPLGQLSACFVLPVEDSLSNGRSGIYDTLRSMALVHQSGGGTGFAFSSLRPQNDLVRSTMGVASGPVSFMRLYDASTEVVKQGGTRRGANMGILRVDHPDIREFISCKGDVSKITNFNISVAVTDEFMAAVEEGRPYALRNPRSGEAVAEENAREIFDLIVESAWATGEPGVFFIDRANEENPVPTLGSYEATNPCGEQPLLPYDVCNLGSVNVGAFARPGQPNGSPPEEHIDWEGLRDVVQLSTRFLDNVVDANRYPLPQIHGLAHQIRRVGLGIMGWADLLVRVGVPYDSPDGVELGEKVMAFVNEEARRASEALAEERGVFPAWEASIWGPDASCARRPDGERIRPMRRLRNCNLTTVAPTGTISIIADCSGGIEPLFAVAFMRNQAGALMPDVNQDFVRLARSQGWYTEALMRRVAEEGTIHLEEVPEDVQRLFVTAHDVTPEWHIRMQAAFQAHVDSAISKTCNFSQEATPAEVREIYELAFRLGCKGVTVYRDGSRPMQVLSTGRTAKEVSGPVEAAEAPAEVSRRELERRLASLERRNEELEQRLEEGESRARERFHARSRPRQLRGVTRRIRSPLGTLYVTINQDEEGEPFEVFANLGKAGGAAAADVEAIGRLVSLALRSGIELKEIHRQLRGISCDRTVGFGPNKVLSVPDALAQVIEEHEEERAGVQQELPIGGRETSHEAPSTGLEPHDPGEGLLSVCPECASQLYFAEGCMKCLVCGYSECG